MVANRNFPWILWDTGIQHIPYTEAADTIPSRALGSTVMIERWNVEEQMSLFGF